MTHSFPTRRSSDLSHFSKWEHEKAPKRKGGRVYIAVNNRGEVTFHEGYVTQKEGQRLRKAEAEGKDVAALPKMVRPELTSTLTGYVDLHRHAAVRAELASHPDRKSTRLNSSH